MKKHTPEQVTLANSAASRRSPPKAPPSPRLSGRSRSPSRRITAGNVSTEARRLRDLAKENARLKKLLAAQMLDNDLLKEVVRGKF